MKNSIFEILHWICYLYCRNPLFCNLDPPQHWVSVNISIYSFFPPTSFNHSSLSDSCIYSSNFFLLLLSLFSFFLPLFLFSPYSSTTDYRLVIICSDEDEDKSHIISRLSTHRQHFSALHIVAKYREYLKTHFTFLPARQSVRAKQQVAATLVDCEKWVFSSYYIHIPDIKHFYTHMHTQFLCKGSQLY